MTRSPGGRTDLLTSHFLRLIIIFLVQGSLANVERKIGGKTSDFGKITRIALLPFKVIPLNIVWCKMVPLGCGLSSGLAARLLLELAAAVGVEDWLGIRSFLTVIGTEGVLGGLAGLTSPSP